MLLAMLRALTRGLQLLDMLIECFVVAPMVTLVVVVLLQFVGGYPVYTGIAASRNALA